MTAVNIYLNFKGNCEEAFTFYKQIFKSEFSYLGRFKDMPKQEGMPPLPVEMENMIMHVGLPIGDKAVLMGSDTGGEWAPDFKQGNNFSIAVTAESKEETDRLFLELSQDGVVTMPLENTFWGDYFGMLTDKFGINWMISSSVKE